MIRRRGLVVALVIVLAAGCAADVGREEWLRMTTAEKTLYVNSLIGAEKARERKGGTAMTINEPVVEIVARIDAVYAQGDRRRAEEIFSTLARRQDSQPPPLPASL